MCPPTGDSRFFSTLPNQNLLTPPPSHTTPHPAHGTNGRQTPDPPHRWRQGQRRYRSQAGGRRPAGQSAYCMAWGSSCITSTTALPPAATLRSRSSSSNWARTSRKAPGSSNRMVVPPWASAMARYTRWRSPPESARTSRLAQSSVPVRRMACSTAAVSCAVIRREKPRYGNRPCATSARTVIPGTGRDCGINAAVRANSLRP